MNACNQAQDAINIPGKIVIYPINKDTCFLYSDGVFKNHIFPNFPREKPSTGYYWEQEKTYSGIVWFHEKDNFLCVENLNSSKGRTIKSNIVSMDINGKITDKIFESENGHYVGNLYPSYNDSLLLFTAQKNDSILDIFHQPVNIYVMDLNSKNLILSFENFAPNLDFRLDEFPWANDGKSFVYCISHGKQVKTIGEKEPELKNIRKSGVYIYNIVNNSHERIAEEGELAVWSPDGETIAYSDDKTIWLYNTQTKSKQILYEAGLFEQLLSIHWTADSKYLYLNCPKNYPAMLIDYDEKLFRISDLQTVSFNKLNIGYNPYTWK